jgi:phosphoesterase RecJ-like protein
MTDLPALRPEVGAQLDAAAGALGAADRILVACHIGPDGDALGSLLAVGLSLGRAGKTVFVGWGEEAIEVPAQYAFLPGVELVQRPADLPGERTAFAIDCASADRLGCLRERMEKADVLVNLDHHVSNTSFGTVNLVDVDAPSSSELVLRLLERMGAPIDADVATCLYTGLVTDTGRFSYSNVTPRAHATAAWLIERGVRVDAVSQAVYESLPFGYLKTLGLVLERCELYDDVSLVVSHLTQSDLSGRLSLDETEGLIDDVRKIREADVAAILKELADGHWKVSLRSKGATDVGAIAQRFGGGGHRLAAGYTSELGLQESVTQLRGILADRR